MLEIFLILLAVYYSQRNNILRPSGNYLASC